MSWPSHGQFQFYRGSHFPVFGNFLFCTVIIDMLQRLQILLAFCKGIFLLKKAYLCLSRHFMSAYPELVQSLFFVFFNRWIYGYPKVFTVWQDSFSKSILPVDFVRALIWHCTVQVNEVLMSILVGLDYQYPPTLLDFYYLCSVPNHIIAIFCYASSRVTLLICSQLWSKDSKSP